MFGPEATVKQGLPLVCRKVTGNSKAPIAIADIGSLDPCAVHEAGHAVAAQVLAIPHDGATVEPDRCGTYQMAPKPSGETFIIDPRAGWSRRGLWAPRADSA